MSIQAKKVIGVAEAKAHFSDIIQRVANGQRFLVTKRGKPVLALVSPEGVKETKPKPLGLLAGVGALAEWEDLPQFIEEVYEARRKAKDRPAPNFS